MEVARKTNSSKTETTNANWRRGEAGNGSDVEDVVGGESLWWPGRVAAEREEGREREREREKAKTLFSN